MTYALWATQPKARIAHRCDCCRRTIAPGEQYQRERGIDDDGPYVWKQCGHCCAFVRLYRTEFSYDWHEGWSIDDIQEWRPDTPEAVEHKRQWALRWVLAPGELYPEPVAAAAPDESGKVDI